MNKIQHYRLVIETTSPMAIQSGGRESLFDTQLARDANGLPYIPATAIAGVWSHLVESQLGEQVKLKWFGTTDSSSVISITSGLIHDSTNKPVVGLKSKQVLAEDRLLSVYLQDQPLHRERVKINDRGVAFDSGKFDQLMLPTGTRFSLSFSWSDARLDAEDIAHWQAVLACWADRRFVLGGSTRNGLGQFKVIDHKETLVELKKGADSVSDFVEARDLSQALKGNGEPAWARQNKAMLFAELPLQALDNWRCGAGSYLLGEDKADADILTYSETSVIWQQGKGSLAQPQALLCGSSIKGILAHRIAFHYRRHTQDWAEEFDNKLEREWQEIIDRGETLPANSFSEYCHQQWQQAPEGLRGVFGHADKAHHNSFAGCLYVDDSQLDYSHTLIRQHNSIDRFTGGVRQGALYNEQLLYQPKFTLSLWLSPDAELDPPLQLAIKDTLDDLQQGLLPMGAGSGRGASLVLADVEKEWKVNSGLLAANTQEVSA